MAVCATGCSSTAKEPDHTAQPLSDCAAVDSAAAAAPPAKPLPAATIGFDDYTEVRTCDYPGPSHYGWSSLRFKTADGVHCELYDGPNSFQYYSSINCWGPLPGVLGGATLVTLEPGSVPVYGKADLENLETQYEVGFKTSPVDPGRYRELAPGQKIIVPGSRRGSGVDMNDEVCAVGRDSSLICEIQHSEFEDFKTHGFRLSAQGSKLY
ncbi:hypothetical protein ACNO8X_04730 [Mycobacterium sp. PDNC021]|uniref:hypothetical protein n=1 Tax=Mycobacterium sp. PDNC021 TaxID=3391399 RepID=UPI003AAD941F